MLGNIRAVAFILVAISVWYIVLTSFDLKKFKDIITLESKYQERLNSQEITSTDTTSKQIKTLRDSSWNTSKD